MTDERPNSLAAQAASWVPPWERAQRPPDPAYAAAHRGDDDTRQAEPDATADSEQAEPDAAADTRQAEPDVAADPPQAGPDAPDHEADLKTPAEARGAEARGAEPRGAEPLKADPLEAYGLEAEPAGDVGEAVDGAGAGRDEASGTAPAGDDAGDLGSAVVASAAEEDGQGEGTDPGLPPELPPVPGEGQGPVTVDAPQELPGDEELDPTDVGAGPEVPVPGAIEEAAEREAEASPLVDAPLPEDGDDAGDVFDHAADDDVTDDAEVDLPIAEEVPGPEEDGEAPDPAGAGRGADRAAAAGAAPSSGIPAQGRRSRGGGAASGASSPRTEEVVELAPLDEGELRAALEAILLVVDEPVAEMQLAQIVEQPTERVAAALDDISARYTAAGHGFDLRRAAGGWRLYTRPEYAPYVERFVLDGQSVRLTQAALETLAVVAYKQPVTRSRISAIRGVNCDGVMRTLVTRGLIEECGTEGETGAFLYRTTTLFLEKLGLNSVDQLPPLAPFLPDDVEEVLDASG